MRPPKEFFNGMQNSDPEQQMLGILKVLLVMVIECGAFVLHYAAYSQTMTLGPGGYLVDVPGIGFLFERVPDMQVNHLIAAAMALASVATPVIGFYYLLRERVLADPGGFFSYIPNRVYVTVLALFWALMVGVEIVNVLTLIQSYVANPFLQSSVADAFREHTGLAILSAVVISIVNAAIGLGTALAWYAILNKKES